MPSVFGIELRKVQPHTYFVAELSQRTEVNVLFFGDFVHERSLCKLRTACAGPKLWRCGSNVYKRHAPCNAQTVFSTPTPQSVLVVDDLRDMRELYKEFLGLNGFQVVQAANGVEALSVAQSVRPAAIVMDLEMPTMGGSEATRALKQDERTKEIPIIVLTGSSRESQLLDARAAGCAALLRKPCMPEVLLEAIRHVLRGEPVPNDLALA